jgi:hypothetical protein
MSDLIPQDNSIVWSVVIVGLVCLGVIFMYYIVLKMGDRQEAQLEKLVCFFCCCILLSGRDI